MNKCYKLHSLTNLKENAAELDAEIIDVVKYCKNVAMETGYLLIIETPMLKWKMHLIDSKYIFLLAQNRSGTQKLSIRIKVLTYVMHP